jgi:hypothetical protein
MDPSERWTIWRVLDSRGLGAHSSWTVGQPFAHLDADEVEVVEVVRAPTSTGGVSADDRRWTLWRVDGGDPVVRDGPSIPVGEKVEVMPVPITTGGVDPWAVLRRIRDHGQTHEEPCWALHKGDCADTMQELARAALAASPRGAVSGRWTIKVCPDCGEQVIASGFCHAHHPASRVVEVEVVPATPTGVVDREWTIYPSDYEGDAEAPEGHERLIAVGPPVIGPSQIVVEPPPTRGAVSASERSAYECPSCGALWPHPSFKCSGIGGFNDHPETATVLVKLVPAPTQGAVEAGRMTRDQFEAWAKEIGLSDSQAMPVWYVIGREYERGRAVQWGTGA